MPEAVVFIATAVADWVAAAVAAGLTSIGVSVPTAITVAQVAATVAFYGTQALLFLAPTVIGAIAASRMPSIEAGKQNFRQAVPPARKGYGRTRIGGYYAFYEAKKGVAYDVIVFHKGKIGGFVSWYAADDPVNVDGSGYISMPDANDNRYGNQKTKLSYRLGLDTETAYADLVTDFPGVWTNDHRGDNLGSFYVRTQSAKESVQANVFPQGVPVITPVADLTPVWDWRANPTDPTVKATKKNVALNFADYLCAATDEGGFGLEFDRRIAPSLAYWTAAADRCDASIAKIGGTEPAYEMGGFFDFTNHPADIIVEFLKCMDGVLCEAGDGSLILHAGEYYEPTITLESKHVTAFTWQLGARDDEATNILNLQFTSPAKHYTTEDADPWIDSADLTARGRERVDTMDLRWVQRWTQARRLGKREMAKRAAPLRGSLTLNLYGYRCMGERYLRLQLPEVDVLADIVIEVTKMKFDLANAAVILTWHQADPEIDAWDPATEEFNDDEITTPDRPPVDAETAPTIESVAVLFVFTAGDYEPVLQIITAKPDREDLRYVFRWRRANGTAWKEEPPQDPTELDTDSEYILTGAVARNSVIEFEIAFVFPDGHVGPWTATQSKDTTGGAGDNPDPGDITDPGGGDPTYPGEVP